MLAAAHAAEVGDELLHVRRRARDVAHFPGQARKFPHLVALLEAALLRRDLGEEARAAVRPECDAVGESGCFIEHGYCVLRMARFTAMPTLAPIWSALRRSAVCGTLTTTLTLLVGPLR